MCSSDLFPRHDTGAAQTALTNAQAEKIRSETTAQKVENLVGIGVDLAKKVAEVRKNKKDTEEVEQKIENLKKTAKATEESIKLIQANVANKEVQTRIAQFQDDINNILKSSGAWEEDGKSYGWRDTVVERYYANFRKDMATMSHDEMKILFAGLRLLVIFISNTNFPLSLLTLKNIYGRVS